MPYKAFGAYPEKKVCHFVWSARSLLNTGFYAILAETCEKSGLIPELFEIELDLEEKRPDARPYKSLDLWQTYLELLWNNYFYPLGCEKSA